MTTIILTLIGIILAAASVAFVYFYGGAAFFTTNVASEAARLTVEGEQIHNAVISFNIREGRIPGDGTADAAMNEVIQSRFLEQAPLGSTGPWVIDYENGIIRSDIGASDDQFANDVCLEARRLQNLPNEGIVYQCDGLDHPDGRLPANEPCCRF